MVSNNHIYSSMRSFNLQIGLLESSVIPVYVDVKNINVWLIYYYFIELWSCTSDAAVLCHLFEMSLISLRSNMECFIIIFCFSGAFSNLVAYLTYDFDTIPEAERTFCNLVFYWRKETFWIFCQGRNKKYLLFPLEDKIGYLLYVVITK